MVYYSQNIVGDDSDDLILCPDVLIFIVRHLTIFHSFRVIFIFILFICIISMERALFGGAMRAIVPDSFTDVSTIRQVNIVQ